MRGVAAEHRDIPGQSRTKERGKRNAAAASVAARKIENPDMAPFGGKSPKTINSGEAVFSQACEAGIGAHGE